MGYDDGLERSGLEANGSVLAFDACTDMLRRLFDALVTASFAMGAARSAFEWQSGDRLDQVVHQMDRAIATTRRTAMVVIGEAPSGPVPLLSAPIRDTVAQLAATRALLADVDTEFGGADDERVMLATRAIDYVREALDTLGSVAVSVSSFPDHAWPVD
jgi:hypothetical protein